MKIYTPNEYTVELDNEELVALDRAADILNALCQEMEQKEMDTLEGGYEDCPYNFDYKTLKEIKTTLREMVSNPPHTMY